jgi:predicted porin
MQSRKLLLGSTALVAAMLAGDVAYAAAVVPGGALDLTLTGRVRAKMFGGDLDNARLDNTVSTSLDFASDARFDIIARAKHDGTGIEYGGVIRIIADTNADSNGDETYVFMRGGFGEFRFGDDDGVADDDKIGGFSVAAGTGGIDGSIVDTIALNVVGPANTGDDTKAVYRSPSFGGLSVNISYAPNNDNGDAIAPKDADPSDFIEGSVLYKGSFGGVDIAGSVVGGICDSSNSATSDTCRTVFGGATIGLWGFKLGAGYGSENLLGDQRDWFNAGVGAALGPVNLSVTYGQITDTNIAVNGNTVDEPANLVVSADVGLMPGLVLQGDVGLFDNDVQTGPNEDDDDGYQAVARLALEF